MNLTNPLPGAGNHGTTISWSEPNGYIDSVSGEVTRPSYAQGDQTVTLTATVSKVGGIDRSKPFILVIKAHEDISPDEAISLDMAALTWSVIQGGNVSEDNIIDNLVNPLPTQGLHGTSITWSC